ncbi:hypothetical protein D3C78_932770 [compost metagenome]
MGRFVRAVQLIQHVRQPGVVVGIRALFQCFPECIGSLLPFAVFHQQLTQRAVEQRCGTVLLHLLTQRFFQLLRIAGLQARDQQHQTLIVLTLQAIEYDFLRQFMVIAFDQVIHHCNLQRNLMASFAALIFPPAFQTLAAFICHGLIHQANVGLLLQRLQLSLTVQVDLAHRRQDLQQRGKSAGAQISQLGQTQHFRVTRRLVQQAIDTVTCGMVFALRQLDTHASDIYRQLVGVGGFGGAFQVLVSAEIVTALLRGLGGQQVVHHRLFGVIGVARQQFFDLLVIAFGQFDQSGLGLLARTAAFTPQEPAAGMSTGAEDAAQDPFDHQQHDKQQDAHDHQAGDAGFDIVVIGLNQHIALMAGQHRPDHHAGDQHQEQK